MTCDRLVNVRVTLCRFYSSRKGIPLNLYLEAEPSVIVLESSVR